MTAKTLMIQGAASSVGKSLLVAGLCRLYARRGLAVAPFKAQNMSNNAGVTPEGGEIGHAQVTQAEACGIPPHVDMNPVLLKPEADSRSQVVVLGQKLDTLPARDYYRRKDGLWDVVTAALARLRERSDLVLIEGAGSPAEVNLRRGDIVNMAVALHANAPVLLAGDIDKGGIFAQLLGTLWLLAPEERALVKGLLVNKFRGDPSLFTDGVRILEERGGLPVLGVIPWLRDHGIPEEDGAGLDDPASTPILGMTEGPQVDIAVIKLPRIANFDDFDPLAAEAGVRVRFVQSPEALGQPDAVILPGTKHTLADLAWLHTTGLAEAVSALAAAGVSLAGICGGYQMLGQTISDPDGVEGGGEAVGLGLLPASVVFRGAKVTQQAVAHPLGGWPWLRSTEPLTGYEIHAGQAETPAPLLELRRRGWQSRTRRRRHAGWPHLGHPSARVVSQRRLPPRLVGEPGLAGDCRPNALSGAQGRGLRPPGGRPRSRVGREAAGCDHRATVIQVPGTFRVSSQKVGAAGVSDPLKAGSQAVCDRRHSVLWKRNLFGRAWHVRILSRSKTHELAAVGGRHPAPRRNEHGRGAGTAGCSDQASGQPGPAGSDLRAVGGHHRPAAATRGVQSGHRHGGRSRRGAQRHQRLPRRGDAADGTEFPPRRHGH